MWRMDTPPLDQQRPMYSASLRVGLAGLALTATLNLTQLMNWMVRTLTELEMGMNSVERILEYTEEPGEAPAHIPSARYNPAAKLAAAPIVVCPL